MADKAHYQTDLKLEEMERRLSAIYSRAEKEIQQTANEYFSKFAKQDEAKRKLLEQGILQGESMDKIAKRLRNVQEMNRTQAIRSARATALL